jgi:hypothetical protein
VRTYWEARSAPNVDLFHYADLWRDLDGEMRRVADALGIDVDEEAWPALVEAATIDRMRSRAEVTAPNADDGLWRSPESFFKSGGTRDWAAHLSSADLARFEDRLSELADDAAGWVLRGRAALV